jgi:beta-phosphoglucomutase-like phosphatase (HAD superfamily)
MPLAFVDFVSRAPGGAWEDLVRDRAAALRREAEREFCLGSRGDEPLEAIVARKLADFRAELPALRRDHRRRRAGTDELLQALAELAPALPSAEARIAV